MQDERGPQESLARRLPEDVLWVRFVFVDHAGIPKCKAVYKDGFEGRARAGVGLAKGVLALDPGGALHPESGLSPVGECRLVPDLSTLAPLPFARGQAMVACDMTEPDAGTPWEGCPRGALKRVLGRLSERGYGSVASYETEFYVRSPEGPLDRTPYAGSFALTPAADFMAELTRTLEEVGIPPEQCHAEVGHGNLELSVGEDEALAAADRRVMVLEAVRGVAHRMGLEATMVPKPFLDQAGNGHHLHVSLYEDDAPVLFDASGALSGPGSGFVAGLLEHLPALMAFTVPSSRHVGLGLRRLRPGQQGGRREARLARGRQGIRDRERRDQTRRRHGEPLPRPGRGPGRRNRRDGTRPRPRRSDDGGPGHPGRRGARRPGHPAAPASPDEALDALEENGVLTEALGEPLVRTQVAVARAQAAVAKELSPEEVAAVDLH